MAPKGFFPRWGCFVEKAARVVLCGGIAVLSGMAALAPAHAQTTRSALANINLPAGARDWASDGDGSKAATLDFAASLAGISCAERESRVWPAASAAAADDIATRTNTALMASGWALQPLSHTPDGQRILQARRGNDRLLMVWQPGDNEAGLLMCRAEGAVAGDAPAPETAETPAAVANGTPADSVPSADTAPRGSRIDDAFGEPTPRGAQAEAPSSTEAAPLVAPAAPEEVPAPPPEAPAGPPAKLEPAPVPAIVEPSAGNASPAGDFGLPALVVAVLALVGGGIVLIVREMRARRLDTAWQWPTATTTIERGWIEEEEETDRRGLPVTLYLPVLKYRYTVDGEDYEGSQIGLDDLPMKTAEAARSRLAKYPDFTTVEIRYDPEDPAFAVIEAPRPKPGQDFYFGIGAIVIALGVLLSHFF